ncbi:MAG TPA: GAF domain-containing protein, partial [Anaerolineae bacterium]|nr:GAF domain-containing protein [Anaerolineae bacterium]
SVRFLPGAGLNRCPERRRERRWASLKLAQHFRSSKGGAALSDGQPTAQGAARYRHELALLRTLIASANNVAELEQSVGLCLRTILRSLGEGFAGLVLLTDPPQPGLRVIARRGLASASVPDRVFADGGPCSRVLASGLPRFERGCAACDCGVRPPPDQECNLLVFPLVASQATVGLVCVLGPPHFQVDIFDLSLWADIGKLLGLIVENALLHRQSQGQRDLLQALYAVSNHLATSLDLEYVLSRVLDLSIRATGAADGSIFLLSMSGSPAPYILRRDLSATEADEAIQQVVNRGLAGWVMRNKVGAIVADTSQDPRWHSFEEDVDAPASALAVPLMANDRVLGVLTLDHPEPHHFGDRHLVLMLAIAQQSSAAIEKARLYHQLSHVNEMLEQRVEERTRELRETQGQLIQAEKMAALGELAAGVVHEINNPLHILQAYIDYLDSQTEPDTPIADLLDPMRHSLENIAHLTAQLRDFSRPAAGERSPVDINDALRQVLRLANKELMHSQIRVEQVLAPDLPPVIGDRRQLEQVFLNLILNARDAMPEGGRLRIETSAQANTVYIRFADSGIGIAPEDLGRIFEPYFTTKSERGTGLGLAISQRIIHQHGGQIAATSREGRGATFTLTLPGGDAVEHRTE